MAMYAEFILKIVVLQVADCIKLCLISVGYRTVVHLIPYHFTIFIHNLVLFMSCPHGLN